MILQVVSRPSYKGLRDLIALFQRYKIDHMSQLAIFLSDANRDWFANPKMFWYRKVFGGDD